MNIKYMMSLSDMMEFCKVNNIISFADFFCYVSKNRRSWFKILCDSEECVNIMVDYFEECRKKLNN